MSGSTIVADDVIQDNFSDPFYSRTNQEYVLKSVRVRAGKGTKHELIKLYDDWKTLKCINSLNKIKADKFNPARLYIFAL